MTEIGGIRAFDLRGLQTITQGELQKAEQLLEKQSTPEDVYSKDGKLPGSGVSSSGTVRPVAELQLQALKGLCEKYGSLQGLDVAKLAHDAKKAAQQSLLNVYDAVQVMKKEGRLVRMKGTTTVSNEAVLAVQNHTAPNRVIGHIRQVARQDLCRLLDRPGQDDVMHLLVARDLGDFYRGQTVPERRFLGTSVSLQERFGRMENALLVLLDDPRISTQLQKHCIYQLQRCGGTKSLATLERIAGNSQDSTVKSLADKSIATIKKLSHMTVVTVGFETKPWNPGGGLGNFMEEHSKALVKAGHRVVKVIPRHTQVDRTKLQPTGITVQIHHPGGIEPVNLLKVVEDGVELLFLENDKYFSANRNGVYGDVHGAFGDNAERYDFFGMAAAQAVKAYLGDDKPDIWKANDAHTATSLGFISTDPYYANTKSGFVIHNMGSAYQVRENSKRLTDMAARDFGDFYPMGPLEYFGDINFMKFGIVKADRVFTVSNGYKDEILTPELGVGLHGVLRTRDAKGELWGVSHGVDPAQWDPETDPVLPANFSFLDQLGKAVCKAAVQKKYGLPEDPKAMLWVMCARIASQKGYDDVIRAIRRAKDTGKNVQVVIAGDVAESQVVEDLRGLAADLGATDFLEKRLFELDGKEKGDNFMRIDVAFGKDDKVGPNPRGYTNDKEKLLYAGADLELGPSGFEPGGLAIPAGMRFLSPGLVKNVGGHGERIQHYDPVNGTGNGFKYDTHIEPVIDEIFAWYERGGDGRQELVRNVAATPLTWEERIPDWEAQYRDMVLADNPMPIELLAA